MAMLFTIADASSLAGDDRFSNETSVDDAVLALNSTLETGDLDIKLSAEHVCLKAVCQTYARRMCRR